MRALFLVGMFFVLSAPSVYTEVQPITDEDAINAIPLMDVVLVPTGKVTVLLDQPLGGAIQRKPPAPSMIEGSAISEEVLLKIQALQKIDILKFTEDNNFGRFSGSIPPPDYTPTAEVERARGIRTKGTVEQTEFGRTVARNQGDNPTTTGIRGNTAVNRAIRYREYRQFGNTTYAIVTQTYHIDLTPEYKKYTELMGLKIEPDRKAVALLVYRASSKDWALSAIDTANQGGSYNTKNVYNALDSHWKTIEEKERR